MPLFLVVPAHAAFEGAAAPAGSFQGPAFAPAAVDTAAKALKAKDDKPCVLEESIVSSGPERERYIFKDSTGQMVIELDDGLFTGRTVTPSSTIRIYGEVDTRFAAMPRWKWTDSTSSGNASRRKGIRFCDEQDRHHRRQRPGRPFALRRSP